LKIALWILVFVIIFLLSVRYIERQSIYFPMKEMSITPSDVGLSYEDIYFTTSDGKRLNGWFVPGEEGGVTVLFFHGNAGNISHRLEKLAIFREMGVHTFIIDYRGYGKSAGVPTEAGLYKDAEAAYDQLAGEWKIPADKIVLYGESIGGGVALDLARKKEVKAVITEDTFTSIKDMARMAYPFLPPFIFESKFDSVSNIKKVECPVLIMHSRDDEIVPFYMGEKLYEAAGEPKELLVLRGSHNTAFLDSEESYRSGIKKFLEGLKK